jgi:hypothetical protein
MPDSFEITGTVVGLEQKRYREGGGLIPGFWNVTLQTDEGARSCSFNSDRRGNPRDPDSEREPHPDFTLLQRAQATGEAIRITGDVVRKGGRSFKNGRTAELAGSAQDPPGRAAASAGMEDARWAVEQALERAEVTAPLGDDDMAHVRREAGKLLGVAREVAADPSPEDGVDHGNELDRRRERRRREGA